MIKIGEGEIKVGTKALKLLVCGVASIGIVSGVTGCSVPGLEKTEISEENTTVVDETQEIDETTINIEELAQETRTLSDIEYNICQLIKECGQDEGRIEDLVVRYEEELIALQKERLYLYLNNNKQDIVTIAKEKGEFQDFSKLDGITKLSLEIFPEEYPKEILELAEIVLEVQYKLLNNESEEIEEFINNIEDTEYRLYLRKYVDKFTSKQSVEYTPKQKQVRGMQVEPYIGMPEEELINYVTWELDDINETINKYGTHKQYCYKGNRYVYVDNGEVTSIQK